MRTLFKDNQADVRMIGGVVGILVTLIIAVLVFYNIAASIDPVEIDENFDAGSPAANATNATIFQAETFFSIAPILAIVVVAVVILKYVGQI